MNSIKNYFTSPMKVDVNIVNTENVIEVKEVQETDDDGVADAENGIEESEESAEDRNKKIVFNMESVLKLISKSEKYRRKKKLNAKRGKSKTPEEVEGQDEKLSRRSKKHRKSFKKRPVKTLITEDNDDVTPDSPAPNITPPNEKNDKENSVENSKPDKSPTKNIFQIMMNSRNKSLGTNSPGKASPDTSSSSQPGQSEAKKKRAEQLGEWAAKKGGLKRQLNEAAEEKYAEKVLDRRAKRFKRSLLQPGTSSEVLQPEVVAVEELDSEAPPKSSRRERKMKNVVVVPETVTSEVNQSLENEEFLKKLNSPIKKRDSLLGYFAKVNKSPDPEPEKKEISKNTKKPVKIIVSDDDEDVDELYIDVEEIVEVKKEETLKSEATEDVVTPRRGRKKKIQVNPVEDSESLAELQAKSEIVISDSEAPQQVTPGGRPKRSCTSKVVSYDIFDKSPLKNEKAGHKKTTTSGKSRKEIDEDYSKTAYVKLAPLFMKPSPKPIVDPVVQKAKQDFLMSGIPEKMRNEIEKQKVYEDYILNEAPLFPETSHIHQFDGTDDDTMIALNASEYKDPKIRIKVAADDSDSPMVRTMLVGCFTELNSKDFDASKAAGKPKYTDWPKSGYAVEGVKEFLRQLKVDYGTFPTFRCYKLLNPKSSVAVLKRTEAQATVDTKKQANSKKRLSKKVKPSPEKPTIDMDDSVEIVEEPKPIFSAANGEHLFSETFKPASSDEFIINPTPIGKLKTFLTSWQSSAAARLLTPKTNGNDSSDDFVESDSNMSASTTCNSIVLCGPHSCGKTSSVYALANEMKFNVLEVNAGNKRTGKKLLQELLEATQSHQVRNNEDKPESLKKKTKSKFLTEQENSESSNRKMSLILIEDADIVFDADFGFIDAINQLVTISKRPVIITSNSSNCAHLLRHIQQNSIDFMAPGCDAMSKWLSIMCLTENVPMDDQVIRRLYLYNQKDLRRTILELQFYVQSGGDRIVTIQTPAFNGAHKTNGTADETSDNSSTSCHDQSPRSGLKIRKHNRLYDFYTKNQNKANCRNDKYGFDNLWCNMNRMINFSKSDNNKKDCDLESLVFFYNNITVAEKMCSKDVQDNLVDCLNEHISQDIVERCLSYCEETFEYKPEVYDELKMPLKPIESLSLDDCVLNSRSNSLDYQPFLRNICRSEKERGTSERKRSRFHHHLRYIIPIDSFSNNDFDIHCDIFKEE